MVHADAHAARRAGALFVATLVAVLAAAPATAGRRPITQVLKTTGADPNAAGRAQLVLRRNGNGKFELSARHLDPHATFDVVVGGVKVGSLATNGHGAGKVRFRTRPGLHDGPLGFDPRGRLVSVRNVDGQDILSGTLPDDSSPDAVACCAADGATCTEQTADACTQAGGTVSEAASCLPNPCGDSAGGAIICCIPDSATGALLRDEGGHEDCQDCGHHDGGDGDDDDVDCTDELTQLDCATRGGTVVQATSCHPNPCAAATPPAEVTACCVPDDDEVECKVLTPERCTARGGTAATGTSCAPDSCGESTHHDGGHGDGRHHHHHH
jgi:hypothetical protein